MAPKKKSRAKRSEPAESALDTYHRHRGDHVRDDRIKHHAAIVAVGLLGQQAFAGMTATDEARLRKLAETAHMIAAEIEFVVDQSIAERELNP